MEILLKAGVNINCVEEDDDAWLTPLTSATSNNQIEAVKLLIHWSAPVGQSDTRNCPADLSQSHDTKCSVSVDKPDDTKCSVSIGKPDDTKCPVSIDKPAGNGWTALITAAHYNYKDIAHLLMKSGADVNYTYRSRQPIHYAAEQGNTGIIEILLQAGACVNAESPGDGDTPLILASTGGHTHTVQFLLSQGADVEMEDMSGNRALHWAAGEGHIDTVAALIEVDTNIDSMNNNMLTPLIFSCRNMGNIQIAKMLLEHGADVRFDYNYSALDGAILKSSRSPEQMAFLYAAGASICPRVLSRYTAIIPQFIIDDHKPILNLLGLCRRKIRTVLLSPAWGNQKYLNSAVVAQLPLPKRLKESLLFDVDI